MQKRTALEVSETRVKKRGSKIRLTSSLTISLTKSPITRATANKIRRTLEVELEEMSKLVLRELIKSRLLPRKGILQPIIQLHWGCKVSIWRQRIAKANLQKGNSRMETTFTQCQSICKRGILRQPLYQHLEIKEKG